MDHPKENRTLNNPVLIQQFLGKGYQYTEIVEQDATIIIFSHDEKSGNLPEHLFEEIRPLYHN